MYVIMAHSGDLDFDKLMGPRATERFGGREAVGSALWLEHVDDITFLDEVGEPHVLTPADLAEDEVREANAGYPSVRLDRIYGHDADFLTRESLLRQTMLPMLPLRITGDTSREAVRFNAEFSISRVPRQLAQYAGILAEIGNEAVEKASESGSIMLSLRLVPTVGRVESVAIYPGYTNDERYGITAVEFGSEAMKAVIGYQKYVEVYRTPQEGELPDLIAPHQF